MKIGICSDHAGYEWKTDLVAYLSGKGYEIVDYGTNSTESMDYPDVAHLLGRAVSDGAVDKGIAMCGTGNGMAITLNKYPKVRAGLAWNEDIAALVKQHNNANVLAMGGRVVGPGPASEIVRAWMTTEFSHGERHQRRIDKMMALENK